MRKPKRLRISGQLRALAVQKGFAVELTIQGSRLRLIDQGIGHAIKNSERGLASFTEREAMLYLAECEPPEQR